MKNYISKLKNALVLFLICCGNQYLSAQTTVGGLITVNTNWTLAGSPYIIDAQNVTVQQGVSLNIQPGVIIKLNVNRSITVDGNIRAVGTQIKPITFTKLSNSTEPLFWGFIKLSDLSLDYNPSNNTGSIFEHCIIEYGGCNSVAAIQIGNTAPAIKKCNISNNLKEGIFIQNCNKNININNCSISKNKGNGIAFEGKGSLIINTCTIFENAEDGILSKAPSNQILNSLISKNSKGLNLQGNGTHSNDIIKQNIIRDNNNDGIFLSSNVLYSNKSTYHIEQNVINFNSSAGINCIIAQNTDTIFTNINVIGNTIDSNSRGVQFDIAATENNDHIYHYHFANFSNNTFSDNSIQYNKQYGISIVTGTVSGYEGYNTNRTNVVVNNNQINFNGEFGISCALSSSSIAGFTSTSISANIDLRNNTVSFNNAFGIKISSYGGSTHGFNGCKTFIKSNSVHNNGGFGISSISNASTSVSSITQIENNEVVENNSHGILTYSTAPGIGSKTHIRGNSIHHNKGSGIKDSSMANGIRRGSGGFVNSAYSEFANNIIAQNSRNGIEIWHKSVCCIDGSKTATNSRIDSNSITKNGKNGISYIAISEACVNQWMPYIPNPGLTSSVNQSICSMNGNRIEGNKNTGINYLSDCTSPEKNTPTVTLDSNFISRNGDGGFLTSKSSNVIIVKNKFIRNKAAQGAAINMTSLSVGEINNNIFAGNIATQEGGAIYMQVEEQLLTMKNNSISNNAASNSSAIYYQGAGNLKASHNTIMNNTNTQTNKSTAIFIGSTAQNATIQFDESNIYNTKATKDLGYEIYAQIPSTSIIDATRNFWNKSNFKEIRGILWDYVDDNQNGYISFGLIASLPIVNAPIAQVQNIIKKKALNGVQISWTSNIEADLGGYKIHWGNFDGVSFAHSYNLNLDTLFVLHGISLEDTIAITAYDIDHTGSNDQIKGHESWFGIARKCSDRTFTFTTTSPSCHGLNDGAITVDVSSLTDPFTVAWNTNPVQSTPTASGLGAGKYIWEILAFDGCQFFGTGTLEQPAKLTLDVITSRERCFGTGDASASVSVVGGNAPYLYSWSNVNSEEQKEPSLTGLGEGEYGITVTDAKGCFNKAIAAIDPPESVLPEFTVSNQEITQGETSLFTNLTVGRFDYLWNFGDGNISTALSPQHVYENEGVYTVSLLATNKNGCRDSLILTDLILVSAGTKIPETIISNNLQLFPNPAADQINMRFATTLENVVYEILDITGRTVSTFTESIVASGEITSLNTSFLKRGNYFLRIRSDKGILTKMFMHE